ncbi:Hypothetical_protein [Hexamita inflata]|uniref:Hypothetical_protein n=1 Tax=Hexamita inflata TaxID=28002 RepID=A0AA86NB78_9EUKA|nr:Hypothetical protein HINF_LOCUS4167 [Hexamita inflata]
MNQNVLQILNKREEEPNKQNETGITAAQFEIIREQFRREMGQIRPNNEQLDDAREIYARLMGGIIGKSKTQKQQHQWIDIQEHLFVDESLMTVGEFNSLLEHKGKQGKELYEEIINNVDEIMEMLKITYIQLKALVCQAFAHLYKQPDETLTKKVQECVALNPNNATKLTDEIWTTTDKQYFRDDIEVLVQREIVKQLTKQLTNTK